MANDNKNERVQPDGLQDRGCRVYAGICGVGLAKNLGNCTCNSDLRKYHDIDPARTTTKTIADDEPKDNGDT